MKKLVLMALCLIGWSSCIFLPKSPADYVDPFIGTGFHGHTYPGATLPNGAVQLSPDTRRGGWDGCSGYHYSDSTILGFSHTHLSGTLSFICSERVITAHNSLNSFGEGIFNSSPSSFGEIS